MKIAIYGKSFNPDHLEFFKLLMVRLEEAGCQLMVWEQFHEFIKGKFSFHRRAEVFNAAGQLRGNADFLFSVGGDGTLLDAIQLIGDSGIPILGINLGRMGFLSSISRNDIIPAITDLMNGRYSIEKRTLLCLESPAHLFGEMKVALNELSIHKRENASMIVVNVWVNDHYLSAYWSDGLIVATPTGSTAYSLSCNGPIITPDSHNFVITPIAPHNLTVRPLVIPDNSRIRIRVDGREKEALVRLDSRVMLLQQETELIIRKADFEVNLVQRRDENFFSTIRAKLNWGMDIRN